MQQSTRHEEKRRRIDPPPDENFKQELMQFFQKTEIIQKIIVNHINNRVQDFPDPITSTLILMVSSPIQVVFCETGILLFKTSNLPMLPYSAFNEKERVFLQETLTKLDNSLINETYQGCGKFSVQINIGSGNYMGKPKVLQAFVDVMMQQKGFKEQCILQRLSDIIIQRFLSNISVHSDDIASVMKKIWGASSQKHHVL